MPEPILVQKKKPLDAVPVLQKADEKKVGELLKQLKSIESDFGYSLKMKMDTGRTLLSDWMKMRGMKSELYDDQLLSELMKANPEQANKIIFYLEDSFRKAGALHSKLSATGISKFMDDPAYLNVYVGLIPRWRSVIELAKENKTAWEKKERDKLKELEPKKYATIGEQKGEAIPYWQRPAIEVPRSGTNLLVAPGERFFIGEGGKVVPQSVLKVQREIERNRFEGKITKLSYNDFFNMFVPIIPLLDAAVTEVQVMYDKGFSWKGTGKVTLFLALAGLDVVIVGQLATRSAARVTGHQLATSIERSGGRLAFGKAERDVFETAIRELKPGEVKDLWRLARPSKGKGTGWPRVFEELAIQAGDKEITGDLIRAYLKEQTGATRFGRAVWRMKAGTADFFSNGLSFFGRERFRAKVTAEFFNELRMTNDLKVGKALAEGIKKAGMSDIQQKVASDAFFYTMTSFSGKTQRAMLKLVEKRGWPAVIRELRTEIVAAKKAGAVDPFGVGVRNGLAKLIPEYSAAFRYAPIHRMVEFGIFMAIGPKAIDLVFEAVTGIKRGVKPKEKEVVFVDSVQQARETFSNALSGWMNQ